MIQICENCNWWRANSTRSGFTGECHRWPPMILNKWPITKAMNYCGEFQLKPVKPEAGDEDEYSLGCAKTRANLLKKLAKVKDGEEANKT